MYHIGDMMKTCASTAVSMPLAVEAAQPAESKPEAAAAAQETAKDDQAAAKAVVMDQVNQVSSRSMEYFKAQGMDEEQVAKTMAMLGEALVKVLRDRRARANSDPTTSSRDAAAEAMPFAVTKNT